MRWRGDLARDAGVCLSLANLLCLGVWNLSLGLQAEESYYFARPVSPSFFLWPPASVVVAGFGLLAGGRWARRDGRALVDSTARVAFVLLTMGALNAIRQLVPALSADRWPYAVLLLMPAAGTAAILLVGPRSLSKAAAHLLLVMLPVLPIHLFVTMRRIVEHRALDPQAFEPRQPADLSPGGMRSRLVILVFDELDRRTLTADMRAFAQLRKVALSADQAISPGDDTLTSIPALFSGQPVTEAAPAGPNELSLVLADGRALLWSRAPSLLADAQTIGHRTALAGWYHPYCRVLGQHLTRCLWFPHTPAFDLPPRRQLLREAILVSEVLPGVPRLRLADRLGLPRPNLVPPVWHARQAEELREAARELCADPRYGLVFAHFPIPHGPLIAT